MQQRFDYLSVEVDHGIAVVRAVDPNDEHLLPKFHPLHRELRDVFPLLAADERVRAVVFAGGKRTFCPFPDLAGLDALLSSRPDAAIQLQREAREIVANLISFDKPLVAGVAVPAVGMGAQLAFLCDFVVACRGITFQDTHVRSGLVSGDGATVVWPLLLGLARARRYVLRGHPMSAEEADELGLVAVLVDAPSEVEDAARTLAEKLATLPTTAYRLTKQALNEWLRLGSLVTLDTAAALQLASYTSPEFLAARAAARERDPD